MKQILHDQELEQIRSTGHGFIYNDYAGTGLRGKDYNILHTATCTWITRSNTAIRKFFFDDLDEALNWLHQNRGQEGINWKRCGSCRAGLRSDTPSSTNVPTPLIHSNPPLVGAAIFGEPTVETILIKHLQQQGYAIHRQVRVASGLIDIVAEGTDGRWIIEAKGEDKGGYASAEMNFQMAIGQILSRMTEAGSEYAIAIPLTDHFQRVLRKYRGSFGFNRLDIWLFVVQRNGQVDRYTPATVAKFIEALSS